ncbi:hypothetical protein C480_18577 [Natrialba aegyptia DSM 13077]|uniref:Uncharacterized protein n=1 Tax=Natrialba aegyptia DSM 13077 TaxID=1227491 RepID=M0ATM4_9EURY|nr:hypothetical protein C480_18577 [Natrialba aegyptia DSM 13077]
MEFFAGKLDWNYFFATNQRLIEMQTDRHTHLYFDIYNEMNRLIRSSSVFIWSFSMFPVLRVSVGSDGLK